MKSIGYLIQACLVILWWFMLYTSQQFFDAFQFPGFTKQAFNSFLLPDIIFIALLSIVNAYNPRKWRQFIILGAFGFATFYCLNAAILTKGGYLSTLCMILGLLYNLFLINSSKVFSASNTKNIAFNGLKTLVQIICVWALTLVIFPLIIINAFTVNSQSPTVFKVVAILLFIVGSSVGLWSAYCLVRYGNGTPLPADQTSKLVIKGPYQIIRNPMALAGMIQGLALAIFMSSVPLLCYTALGGLLWHFVTRPIEERDLQKRFGKAYLEYKNNVGLWLPMLKRK